MLPMMTPSPTPPMQTVTGGPLTAAGRTVRVLAVRYGNPAEVDSYGDYFTPNTQFWLDKMPWPRPMLLEHAMGTADPAAAVVGQWTEARRVPEGVELVGELDTLHPRYAETRAALQAGRLFASSDSAPHLVRRARARGSAREVLSWPLLACSLVSSPAERRLPPAELKLRAYKALGLWPDDERADALAGRLDTLKMRQRLNLLRRLNTLKETAR